MVDTSTKRVLKWIDLRPGGVNRGLRPIGVRVAPLNPDIYPVQYAVVLNQYANFASVIDTTNDSVLGNFETG